jgi:hypothetical protein
MGAEAMPAGDQSAGMSALFREVQSLRESTSRELAAHTYRLRLAWVIWLGLIVSAFGAGELLLWVTSSAVLRSTAGVLVALGLGAGLVLFWVGLLLQLKEPAPQLPPVNLGPTRVSPNILQQALDELVRLRTEVDLIRKKSSDAVLIVAFATIGGLAYLASALSHVTPLFPSGLLSYILTESIGGAILIVWSIFYWRGVTAQTARMASKARFLTEGLDRLEKELWNRF